MQPSNYVIAGRFKEVKGNASLPIAAGHRIIVNLCSANGEWSTYSEPLSKRWNKIKVEYTRWYRSQYKFMPGEISEVNVQSDTCLVNAMVYNKDYVMDEKVVEKCFDKIGKIAKDYGSSVHINYLEDNWDNIQTQLVEKVIKRGVNVTVYKV